MTPPPSSPTRAPARRVPGPVVAIGLTVLILLVAVVARLISQRNIRVRTQAFEAAEAAEAAREAEAREAAERDGAPAPSPSE